MRTMDFNSRPHGGRLKKADFEKLLNISTHTLTEGDRITALSSPSTMIFQLTPSRRATTHTCTGATPAKDFNSRPHGGRRLTLLLLYFGVIFQLTPSRRATTVNVSSLIVTVISTHALTEGDELLPACAEPAEKFQLTPSRRATIIMPTR